MACVLSPFPRPGTSLPTSPTPTSIPSPAATPKGETPRRALRPLSPALGTPLPPVLNVETVGRTKAQRWSYDSPPSGKSGGGAPSFMEVLLKGSHLVAATQGSCSGDVLPAAASQAPDASHQVASGAIGDASARAAPRIVLVADGRGK
ncbi:unnamed protein product [Urochloa humidicola]